MRNLSSVSTLKVQQSWQESQENVNQKQPARTHTVFHGLQVTAGKYVKLSCFSFRVPVLLAHCQHAQYSRAELLLMLLVTPELVQQWRIKMSDVENKSVCIKNCTTGWSKWAELIWSDFLWLSALVIVLCERCYI